MDRFATAGTTLLPRWNSPCPELGAEAVDGLSTDWTSDYNWIRPPLELLTDVATKLERSKAHGVVVAPFWPSEHWFSALHRLSSRVTVVPHARHLVCQHTRYVFGVDAQGDWPLAFFKLDPDRATTRLPPVEWTAARQLVGDMGPTPRRTL